MFIMILFQNIKMKAIRFAKYISIFSFFILSIISCGNLEKEIELDIPPYEGQLVVECYLEPGKPFNLILTKSAAYFEPFPQNNFDFLEGILVDSAVVSIEHNGEIYELENEIYFDLETLKLFNYHNPALVPQDIDHDFTLNINMPDGRKINGRTRILPVVPIDSVVVEFNEEVDTLARVLTYFTDNINEENFYRRMLHEGSLDSFPKLDFTVLDDVVGEDGKVVFGTNFDFAEGDTIINSIFHIDREYHDFLESIFFSLDANGNPFGQPAAINSNVEGGNAIGIFTGLSVDRNMLIIEK